MRIARVDLYALELPLAEPFIISGGRIDARRSVVVVLHDGDGHVGYGESAPDELPFYSEETLGSARDLITSVLAPRIGGREFDSPEAVDAALRENVRGNPFARSGLETAAWDLEAHRRGTGLAQLVAERLRGPPAPGLPPRGPPRHPAGRPGATPTRPEGGTPDPGARRPDGVESQGASRRRARRSVPHLPGSGGMRGATLGRHDARVRDRLSGGHRRRGARGVCLSIGRGAERALVRARRGRDQAHHEPGGPHGGAGGVDRPIARRPPVPVGDPPV